MAEKIFMINIPGIGLRKIPKIKVFRGFTLAEVLITLVIIGVIAAMTIPTLINKTNNQEYVSRLVKTYSTLSQGLNSIWQNNGVAPGDYEFLNSVDIIDELAKVISVQKKCDTVNACLGVSLANTYKFLDNTKASGMTDGKTLITSDGQLYTYSDATSKFYGISAEDKDNAMGRFMIDVNGSKGPNKIGIDTYIFYLIRGKGVIPSGIESNSNCARNKYGQDCTGKVLREKAINY